MKRKFDAKVEIHVEIDVFNNKRHNLYPFSSSNFELSFNCGSASSSFSPATMPANGSMGERNAPSNHSYYSAFHLALALPAPYSQNQEKTISLLITEACKKADLVKPALPCKFEKI